MTTAPLRRVAGWIDARTGLSGGRHLLDAKVVPRHRYSVFYYLGGMALFLFAIQVATGLLLLLYYEPGTATAYESVKRISGEIPCEEGIVLAVEILTNKSQYNTLELTSGRMATVSRGNVVVGASTVQSLRTRPSIGPSLARATGAWRRSRPGRSGTSNCQPTHITVRPSRISRRSPKSSPRVGSAVQLAPLK